MRSNHFDRINTDSIDRQMSFETNSETLRVFPITVAPVEEKSLTQLPIEPMSVEIRPEIIQWIGENNGSIDQIIINPSETAKIEALIPKSKISDSAGAIGVSVAVFIAILALGMPWIFKKTMSEDQKNEQALLKEINKIEKKFK